jgi:hypothetical protein
MIMGNPRRPRARARLHNVTELEWAFLNDAVSFDDDPGEYGGSRIGLWELEYNFETGTGRGVTEELWEAHGQTVVQRWAVEHPGTRPRLWWNYDAPRCDLKSYSTDHTLKDNRWPEPRRRLGGTGTPMHEISAYVPSFSYGIPNNWFEPWEKPAGLQMGTFLENHYAELARRGAPIDPDDPPLFEAQATYLERQGLFLPGERRRLKPEDFEPEAVKPASS